MQYLSTALVILAVTIVMRYVVASARRKPDVQEDGAMVLRLPGFIAGIGYAAVGFGALIAAVTVFQLVPTTGNEVVPYLVSFFVVLGLPLVLLANRIRITVTDQGVRSVGFTKKVREMRWDEVRKVTFSITSELVLHSDRARIKLNTMLVGLQSFIEVMKQRLEPTLYEKALQECETALNNMQGRAAGPKGKPPS